MKKGVKAVIKIIIYLVSLVLSMFFLFTVNSTEFLGSTILFYVLFVASVLLSLSFFYLYSETYKSILVNQLQLAQKKDSISWFGWFSDNLSEFAVIFLVTTPYILTFVSISEGLSFMFDKLSFLNYISIGVLGIFSMIIVFIVISHLVNSIVSKKQHSY
jgi:hypothetical protein